MLYLYTRSHGRMTYLVYGLHGTKKRATKALLEPLSLIRIEAHLQDNSSLGQLRECEAAFVPKQLPFDAQRRCVALFIAEMIYRTVTHPMQDESLFDFLQQTILDLDSCNDPQNAHLRFLTGYAEMLGYSSPTGDLPTLMRFYSENIPDFTPPNALSILETVL